LNNPFPILREGVFFKGKLKKLSKNTKIISVNKIKVLALVPGILLQAKPDT